MRPLTTNNTCLEIKEPCLRLFRESNGRLYVSACDGRGHLLTERNIRGNVWSSVEGGRPKERISNGLSEISPSACIAGKRVMLSTR